MSGYLLETCWHRPSIFPWQTPWGSAVILDKFCTLNKFICCCEFRERLDDLEILLRSVQMPQPPQEDTVQQDATPSYLLPPPFPPPQLQPPPVQPPPPLPPPQPSSSPPPRPLPPVCHYPTPLSLNKCMVILTMQTVLLGMLVMCLVRKVQNSKLQPKLLAFACRLFLLPSLLHHRP